MLRTLLTEAHEGAALVAEPWVFAAIAAAVFLLLGFVTYSYRDVANRHSDKVSADDAHGGHGGHGGHH